jgi:hypothetical protein
MNSRTNKRRRGTQRRKVVSKEERALREKKRLIREQNRRKLLDFLSREKREKKPMSVLGGIVVSVETFSDPVIQAFYLLVADTVDPNFDPRAEFERFLNSYLERFSVIQGKQKKVSKSRKGVGGPKAKDLTQAIQELVQREGIDFETIVTETYSTSYPNQEKPASETPLRMKVHRGKVRERVRRIAPHLLPGNRKQGRRRT